MKTKRNLSGVFLRSKNEETEKWENVCFEDLPEDEQHIVLTLKDREWLVGLVKILSSTLNDIGEQLDIIKE